MPEKRMLKGYAVLSILLIADLLLYLTNGISLIGQISDKILFWAWLIMTPIILLKHFKSIWAKWYLGILVLSVILSLIPLGIPFISVIAFASGSDNERSVKVYKLREGAKSAIALPKIYLLEHWGIFEREIGETEFEIEIKGKYYRLREIEDIILMEDGDNPIFRFKVGNDSEIRTFEMK